MRALRFLAPLSVVSLSLLLFRIDKQSLWLDEAMSLQIAQLPLGEMLILLAGMPEQHPFYYVLLRTWLGLGSSEIVLRSLSVLFALASVWGLYFFTTYLFGDGLAKVATIILAVSPYYIYYGQEARMYTLLGFLALANSYFFVVWTDGQSKLSAAAYVLSGVAGVYTHFCFFFLLSAHLCFVLIREKGFGPKVVRTALWQGLILLGYAPWALVLLRNFPERQGWKGIEHIVFAVPYTALRYSVGYAELAVNYEWKDHILDMGMDNAGVLILATVVFGWLTVKGLRYMRGAELGGLFVMCSAFVPIGVALLTSLATNVILVGERYFVISFPFYVIVLAAGMYEAILPRDTARAIGVGIVALFGLVVGKSLYDYYFGTEFGKEQWRDAARYVSARARPGDVVVFEPGFIRFVFDYYYGEGDPRVILAPDNVTGASGIVAAKQHGRVWLVKRGNSGERASVKRLPNRFVKVSDRLFPFESGIFVQLYEAAPLSQGDGGRRTIDPGSPDSGRWPRSRCTPGRRQATTTL